MQQADALDAFDVFEGFDVGEREAGVCEDGGGHVDVRELEVVAQEWAKDRVWQACEVWEFGDDPFAVPRGPCDLLPHRATLVDQGCVGIVVGVYANATCSIPKPFI